MPIPDQILEEIQNKVSIVDIVSAYVPLKKAGTNYKGLCPFHHEKTPSFMVSPDKQIFHCFGCGAGGNVFGFLMRQERMEFPEAVRFLAEKAEVRLPALGAADRAYTSQANHLYSVNELACTFYQDTLSGSREAQEYLRSRGIQGEAVKAFRIGLAPNSWDALLGFLKKKGVAPELIEKAGLVVSNDHGGRYDRFRERLIFPIFDLRNRILGFGGRVLDSSLPKYVNSPETYLYSKGKNLYGLNLSKDQIKQKNYAIVVEGYVDCIIPFQAGVRNIVATLGTALTQDQARLLKRFAKTCIVVYDPDEAGEAASLRSLDIFISEGINVYIATLRKGYDPDGFIRSFGVEEFNNILKAARNLFDYKLDLLSVRFNPATLHGKVEIAAEMLPTIHRIDNAIVQSALIKKLASALSVEEESLRAELKKVKVDYSRRPVAKAAEPQVKDRALVSAQRMLLAIMLDEWRFVRRLKDVIRPEEFQDHTMRRIVMDLFESAIEERDLTAAKLLNHFKDDEGAVFAISEAAAMTEMLADRDKAFVDCVEMIKRKNVKIELEKLRGEIQSAQIAKDEARLKELLAQYNDLVKPGKS